MATAERGFFGSLIDGLKKALHLEGSRRIAPNPIHHEKPTSHKKEERKDKAELIANELKNITPQHQAYELLRGATFDKKTLAQNENLANFLLEILNLSDPALYHDAAWLSKRREKLASFNTAPFAFSSDKEKLDHINDRVNELIERANENRRRIELEKHEMKKEWLSEEEMQKERTRLEAFGGSQIEDLESKKVDWETIVDDPANATDERYKEIRAFGSMIKEGNYGQRGENWEGFARGFRTTRGELVKELAKTPKDSPKYKDIYNKYADLNKAYEKAAKHYVETQGSERGRLFNAVNAPGAELLEKRIIEDQNYMDYWFYHILESVLFNKRTEGHHELYNLYVAGDMDTFLDIVRKKRDPQTGERIGLRLAARYDILKNTIFQSHDIDYFAAHPSQDMKEFIGSTSLFTNTYIDAATQDPLVSLAKRMYEQALYAIRDTNNGYIPREWLKWQEGKLRGSKLDEMVEQFVKQAIDSGQLYSIKLDDITGTGLPSPSVWGRKQIDPMRPITHNEFYGYESELSDEYRNNLGDLKIAAALKQAKGLALVDMRLLEIIGRSRGTTPSTDYKYGPSYDANGGKFNLAAKQFNSVPYEGIVRHIEPIIHYFSRYRVGFEYYDAFFNMMINDDPKAHWDPNHMINVVKLHQSGDHEKLKKYCKDNNLGNLGTRLLEEDNPFQFSSMWGPNTGWRIGDSSIGFDDWEKDQAYASAVKIVAVANNWAADKAKTFFIEKRHGTTYKSYRNELRKRLINSDDIRLREMALKDLEAEGRGTINDDFETHWRKIGIYEKKQGSSKSYNALLDKIWGKYQNAHGNIYSDDKKKPEGEAGKLAEKLKRAYIARNWIQTAMRSPLIVARELSVKWKKTGSPQDSALRRRIIWDILHIDVDEIAAMRTPLAHEEAAFNRIAELEGAIAAVSQVSIRDNRDLTEKDFDKIENEIIRENAKNYWKEVKKAMLGNYADTPEEAYKAIGIVNPKKDEHARGLRFHHIDYDKINKNFDLKKNKKGDTVVGAAKIPFTSDLLTTDLVNRDWKYLYSTEDMGWEYLNISALGERNPVRRAGDLASHVQFGQLFEKYITNNIIARPKIPDLVKAQKEMWEAMAGDFADIASDATGRIAYVTGQMYRKADWAWRYGPFSMIASIFKDHSIMQIIRGRDRADAWGPNDLLHYVQAVGGQQIVPKRQYSGLGGKEIAPNSQWTGARLGKLLGGTKGNATIEMINTVLFVAMLLTIWRSLTAKSEEE